MSALTNILRRKKLPIPHHHRTRKYYLCHPAPLSRIWLNARKVHRQVIEGCIRRLLPSSRVGTHNLPSTAIITVRRQEANLIIHLLHYIPQRRGKYLDVIEDVIPLYESEVSIRAENKPLAVELVPQGESLPFQWRDGYVKFLCQKLMGIRWFALPARQNHRTWKTFANNP